MIEYPFWQQIYLREKGDGRHHKCGHWSLVDTCSDKDNTASVPHSFDIASEAVLDTGIPNFFTEATN